MIFGQFLNNEKQKTKKKEKKPINYDIHMEIICHFFVIFIF